MSTRLRVKYLVLDDLLNRAVAVSAVIAMAIACSPDVTLVPARGSDPDSTPRDTTDTTVVQRATLTVSARVADAHLPLADQLGFSDGVLTGAAVRARRGVQEFTGTTDALGQVTFPDLLPGSYQVSVLRVLTDGERALLAPEDADVDAFGGGASLSLAPPETTVVTTARATRRGSLVISEVFPSTRLANNEFYMFGTFVELYNNSDTTIFLDGKLIGSGPFFHRDAPEFDRPCSLTQQWQADPEGLWTPRLYRVPGSGRQYPLAPGQAALLATDAVDHRVVDPRWPDLSSAMFEFIGPADVDNPAAGNITTVGTPAFDDLLGHGPWFTGGDIYFIADSLDVTSLPMVQPPNYRVPIPRIPREKVLDVATLMSQRSLYDQGGFELCPVLINEVFDTGPAFVTTAAFFMSIRRRPLGSVVLRSRSTVNDFEVVGSPTPGRIP